MTMNKAFRELFGRVQTEEALKRRTRAFLAEKTRGYTKRSMQRRKFYVCAAACALLMLSGGHRLYFTPIAEISIDINPSIELSVNRFDRVIAVIDYNEDGRELSDALDVKYKAYTTAIEQILENDRIAALLYRGEVITFTVAGPDGQLSSRILSEVEACAAGQRNAYCYAASPEEAASAREAGLSCGKYRAFLELQLLDPGITPETVRGMTMREIREMSAVLTEDGGEGISSCPGRGNKKGCHDSGGRGRGWRNGRTKQQRDGGK